MTIDRRRFFRINDSVGVVCLTLTGDERAEQTERIERLERPGDTLSLLSGFNKTIDSVLNQLRIRDPLVAGLLEAMDQKLNCVIQQMELDAGLVESIAHKVQAVNISACGMALTQDEPLQTGTLVSLELLLLPGQLLVYSHGTVISCDPASQAEGYHTRIEFCGMTQMDQEILIQHLVKRQGVLLRELDAGAV